jgi:hypothetical protein
LLQSYATWMSIASLFALIVGTFIIYNSFAIAVTQRRPEIGILRARERPAWIQRVFLRLMVAGAAGSVVGVLLGLRARRSSSGHRRAGAGRRRRPARDGIERQPELIAAGIGTASARAGRCMAAGAQRARIDPVKALQKGKHQIPTTVETR